MFPTHCFTEGCGEIETGGVYADTKDTAGASHWFASMNLHRLDASFSGRRGKFGHVVNVRFSIPDRTIHRP